MTYQKNGKQYVVISAGGHGKLGTSLGDSVCVRCGTLIGLTLTVSRV
jgi:glucose dehydrogenase